jgi:hypothetical protein
MSFSRNERKIINSKEQTLPSGDSKFSLSHSPSSRNMADGEQIFAKESNKPLALYKKFKGTLWKTYFSNDGNQFVEKKLTTNKLEYTNSFIDYRTFTHNFTDDISTSEIFIPWMGVTEGADMDDARRAYLVPFGMSLNKIMLRGETFTSSTISSDIRVKIYKQDNDQTTDNVAVADYTDDITQSTTFTLFKSDFDNVPYIEAGDKCGISMQASSDPSGNTDWWITSVWRVEIKI